MTGVFLATSLLLSAVHYGTDPPEISIQTWLEEHASEANSPGLTLALWDGSGEIQTAAWGVADLELAVPVEPDHIFRIGSVTKPFTSMLVLQLVDEGELTLDQPLGQVLTGVPEEWLDVTIQQLLNHTSGIPNYTALLRVMMRDVRLPAQKGEILESIPDKALLFEPGTQFDYSNTNYTLLTWVVEALDDQRLSESLKMRITEPLGLEHTYLPTDSELIMGRARGYAPLAGGAWRLPWPISMSWPLGAGGMESSARDLVRFGQAVLAHELLDPEWTERMTTRTELANGESHPYALGWVVVETPFGTIWEHAGGIFGFTAHLLICPDRNWVIAGMANSEASGISELVRRLFAERGNNADDLRPASEISDSGLFK